MPKRIMKKQSIKVRRKADYQLKGKQIGIGILTRSEIRTLKAQDRLKRLKGLRK